MIDGLTPPNDNYIERVPEAPEEEEQPATGFCDSCRRLNMQIARTDYLGRRMCVECEAEREEP